MDLNFIKENFYGYFNGTDYLCVCEKVKENNPKKILEQIIDKITIDDVLKISKENNIYIKCCIGLNHLDEEKEVEKLLNEI